VDNHKLKIFETDDLKFDEEDHRYTYKGVKLTPVTQFIKRFSPDIDFDYWAIKKAKERGVPVEEIRTEWKETAAVACDLGTDVHKWVEDYWNGKKPGKPKNEEVQRKVKKFYAIYKSRLNALTSIKQEFKVFSSKWNLAGTIDGIFEINYTNIVGDWKTNKTFTIDGDYTFGQKLKYPFEDLDNNNLNMYSIQLSLYRLILQEEAGFKTSSAFICHLGQDEPGKIYQAKDLRARLKMYLTRYNLKYSN